MNRTILLLHCFVLLAGLTVLAETPTNANTDPAYRALRMVKIGSEAVGAENLVLKRDAGTFTFTSGTFCFLEPVEGKVTGAVFTGQGKFEMTPPTPVEKVSLSRLTGKSSITEEFHELLLRFTDQTYQELKNAGSAKAAQSSACNAGLLNENQRTLRLDLHWNLSARILRDVYSSEPGGLFAAFIKGSRFSSKMLYLIDPSGAMVVAPEEVALWTWGEAKSGIWAAFHLASEYASGKAASSEHNSVAVIEHQKLDTQLDGNGRLTGTATTTFLARANGLRVVPFDLYPTLRVDKVTDSTGRELEFIQEDKDEDADFWVILPTPLAKGQKATITTSYGGKGAITNEGSGNYYLTGGARATWYPNLDPFTEFANYEMRFSYPKNLRLVATGVPLQETQSGAQMISEWKSDGPQTVAGFHYGRFKKDQKDVGGLALETYANSEIPDDLRGLQHEVDQAEMQGQQVAMTVGSMNTLGMMKKAMAEAEYSMSLFTSYFGASSFKRLAMTQQTASNYGQSWPGMVWMPLSYFLDDTLRHQIYGFDPRGYFKVVGPHEVAHQWWGNTVSWASYRDQWISEGFSEFSAALFLQLTRGNGEFIKFWNEERDDIVGRNAHGFRIIDVGPLTLGYRLDNSKTGDISRRLIYSKGGYILHMLRMMMWDPKTGDKDFKAMMQDFVNTYRNRAATTEDFKAIVEKHITHVMNVTNNGKMDWFFDQWVYGTALPKYSLEYAIDGGNLAIKLTQSNVDPGFNMIVPVYMELEGGKIVRLGQTQMTGNSVDEAKIPLGNLKVKRVMVNYFNDVLSDK